MHWEKNFFSKLCSGLALIKKKIFFSIPQNRNIPLGTSLAVQWLRLRLPIQGVWVRSLVRELRSHMRHSQKTKKKHKTEAIL